MARNVEIKAHVKNVETVARKIAAIANEGPSEIRQDDTFFHCNNGRLKLRTFSDGRGELIFYRRPDQQGPKESFYVISPTSSPDTLRQLLTLSYGQVGRVQKHRTVYLVGRIRVHLDRVRDLGDFLELEVVLREGEESAAGMAEAYSLMGKLDVQTSELVEGAYVNLLANEEP